MNPYSVCENWYPIAKSLPTSVGLPYYFCYSLYALKEHRICASARYDRVVMACPRMIAGVLLERIHMYLEGRSALNRANGPLTSSLW